MNDEYSEETKLYAMCPRSQGKPLQQTNILTESSRRSTQTENIKPRAVRQNPKIKKYGFDSQTGSMIASKH